MDSSQEDCAYRYRPSEARWSFWWIGHLGWPARSDAANQIGGKANQQPARMAFSERRVADGYCDFHVTDLDMQLGRRRPRAKNGRYEPRQTHLAIGPMQCSE